MATDKEYMQFISEQLSGLEDIRFRAMMGEYLLYYRGKLLGGIYDNRLLLKPVAAARPLLPDSPLDTPYEGAKPMLCVTELDDAGLLCELCEVTYAGLPEPKRKKQLISSRGSTKGF